MMKIVALFVLFPVLAFAAFSYDIFQRAKDADEMDVRIMQLEAEKVRQSKQLDNELSTRVQMSEELESARVQLQLAREEREVQPPESVEPIVDEQEPAELNDAKAGVADAVVLEKAFEAGDFQVFYVELSRFGEWFQTDEYGYVWQPWEVETDVEWRPYTRGRWMYSDQGWAWASDEPFGWAVYHYGRWVLLQEHGWVWVPGEDWAPAWVSWRSNDDYLGWAPLPPETLYEEDYSYDSNVDSYYDVSPSWYSFVPAQHFHAPVERYCVPQTSSVSIFLQTSNVTRIYTRNRRVHCDGPDRDWVSKRCGKAFKRYRLDAVRGGHHAEGRSRHHVQGDRLSVFAPQVKSPLNPVVRPARVKSDLGKVKAAREGKAKNSEAVRRFQVASVKRQEMVREILHKKGNSGPLLSRINEEEGEEKKRAELAALRMQAKEDKRQQAEQEKLQKDAEKNKAKAIRRAAEMKARAEAQDRADEKESRENAEKEAKRLRAEQEKRQKDVEKARAEAKRRAEEMKSRAEAQRRAAEKEARERAEKAAKRQRAEQEKRQKDAAEKARSDAKRRAAEMKARAEAQRRAAEKEARKRAEEEKQKRKAEEKKRADAQRRAKGRAESDARKRDEKSKKDKGKKRK